MCIYRIKINGKYWCGKRIPLPCCDDVCPFGQKRDLLVKHDKGDEERYYWVCHKSGRIKRVETAAEAVEEAKAIDGYVCRGEKFFPASIKPKKAGAGKKFGTFEDGMKTTRWADLHVDGEMGEDVKIVIIDSGIEKGLPVSEKISLYHSSMVDWGEHGRYIHRIIHELVPKADISVVQVFGEDIPDYQLISALNKAAELKPDAINMSIQSEMMSDGEDPLSLYVNYLAEEKKIPIVISAGNGGPRMLSIGSPGAAKHAITVGATNAFGDLCKYSSRGPTLDGRFKPDLVAPGSFVLDEFLLEGTSCSAPWVTAIAGIMHKILRSAIAVRRILHLSAKALPLKYETEKLVFARKREKKYLDRLIKSFGNVWALIFDPRNFYGGGVLDAYAALMLTRELLSEIKMAGDAEAS